MKRGKTGSIEKSESKVVLFTAPLNTIMLGFQVGTVRSNIQLLYPKTARVTISYRPGITINYLLDKAFAKLQNKGFRSCSAGDVLYIVDREEAYIVKDVGFEQIQCVLFPSFRLIKVGFDRIALLT